MQPKQSPSMPMQEMHKGNYRKFMLMLAVSYIVMFSVMYLNIDRLSHLYFGLTRFYMTALMIAPMALIMLGFMGMMYQNKQLNRLIVVGSSIVFIGVFALMRTQTGVGDKQYMRAMIPHHSSAILFSRQANLKDPEVLKLSKQIIESQEREIAEMKAMLDRLDAK